MKAPCGGWQSSTRTRVAKPAPSGRVVDLGGLGCLAGNRRSRRKAPVVARVGTAVGLGVSAGFCIAIWGVVIFNTIKMLT